MIENIIDIAVEAGKIILKYYKTDFDIHQKKDQSPVTTADIEADKYIGAQLRQNYPEIPIISEESGIPDYDVRKNWNSFWLVDPLDGTKEFINKNGEFTVNIALIVDGEPILAVVYTPVLETLYYAQKGNGAWRKVKNEAPVQIFSEKADKNKPLRVVESRSHKTDELEQFLKDYTISERISAGSSLKFCTVAEGKADIYPRLGPTMEWDVAAGDCIYRNSARSGQHQSELRYNKPDLHNPNFVIGF